MKAMILHGADVGVIVERGGRDRGVVLALIDVVNSQDPPVRSALRATLTSLIGCEGLYDSGDAARYIMLNDDDGEEAVAGRLEAA